jgi:hypothetical protein
MGTWTGELCSIGGWLLIPVASLCCFVSTAREIEDAIRSLPASERSKLLHHIPDLFPELSGDAEWERIIADERPRPALTELLDKTEAEFCRNPDRFPELTERDFSSPS